MGRPLIYPTLQEPVPLAPVPPVDSWIFPWSEPVRLRTLPTALQQQPAFTITPVLPDVGWMFPWSEPVRTRDLPTALQQANAPSPEPIPLTPTFQGYLIA